MSTLTSNYGLIKPELTDVADITATNQNWEKIDAELKNNKTYTDEKFNSIPTPDVSGQINVHNSDANAHNDIRELASNTKTAADNHIANKSNPHGVTKSQIGLGNVDNTADSAKPVSTAQAAAIADAKKAGTDAQSNLDAHTSNTNNPHGVTASQIGALPSDGSKPMSGALWLSAAKLGRITALSNSTVLENMRSSADTNNKMRLELSSNYELEDALKLEKTTSGEATQYKIYGEHNITKGTADLVAGTSELADGAIHFVYE